jgi:hypothetical protein
VTAIQRKALTQPYTGTIIDLLDAAGMVAPERTPWRSFWKAVYALPMTPEELAVYQKHTKRETPPSVPGEAGAGVCARLLSTAPRQSVGVQG